MEGSGLMYCGEAKHFKENLPHILGYVDFLVSMDEIEFALQVLNRGLPAFYRDHVPQEIKDLRAQVHRFLMNASDYAANPNDIELASVDRSLHIFSVTKRAELIKEAVEKYNQESKVPHVFEMGPGEYWLPIGLKALGYKFSYDCSGLSPKALEKAKPLMGQLPERDYTQPVIFVACEIIEHLADEFEILQCVNKARLDPDEVHLSTPLYTFGNGNLEWKETKNIAQGGHLRTYTADDFKSIARKMFPQYNFKHYIGEIQSIVGNKPIPTEGG